MPAQALRVSDGSSTIADDEAGLWTALRATGEAAARLALIEKHVDFARIIAARLYARRFSDDVEFDEYLQIARVALIESIDRYEPDAGASFRTFAGHRMTGAVLSGLEAMTERARQIALRRRTEQERTQSLHAGRDAPADDTFARLASLAVGLAIGFMLDDVAAFREEDGVYADNAYSNLAIRQTHRRLRCLVDALPAREGDIVRKHYFQQVPFDHIAEQLQLTKGRVSQLHKRAVEMLRSAMHAERLDSTA